MVRRLAPVLPGTLYVVATPIGNLEDITLRAVRVLGEVDLVAAEDTRSARVLLSHHGVSTSTRSLHRDNEARRGAELVTRLQEGAAVALISEAGMPGISDPGFRLVSLCVEAGVPVDVIPGASAVPTALVLSGLPTDQFTFLGFLPRKGKERRRALEQAAGEPRTLVLYESPRRTARTLTDLLAALGDRPAALVREMTKLHQEVLREPLSELARRHATVSPRGEVTLVVGGAEAVEGPPDQEVEREVTDRLARGQSPRLISRELSSMGKRRIYQMALRLRAAVDGP